MEGINMKSRFSIIQFFALFASCFIQFIALAQPPIDNGDVIIIQGSGLREVESAFRLRSNPKLIDTTITSTLPEYPLMSPSYSTQAKVSPIKELAYSNKANRTEKLTPFYAKVGIGSQVMPLGEIYYNSIGKSDFQYGAYTKHISSFGKMRDYAPAQFDRTKSGLYGTYFAKKFSISSDAHYDNYGFHYYGILDTAGIIDAKSIAQRYQDAGGAVKFSLHNGLRDSSKLNLDLGLKYNFFGTKRPIADSLADWKSQEQYVAFTSRGSYKVGREVFSVDLNVFNNSFNYGIAGDSLSAIDTGIVQNDLILQLKPAVVTQLMNDKLRVSVGVDVTANVRSSTKVYVYPHAEIKYSMFDDIFIPYIGIRGGLKQNTLRGLTNVNEFILPNAQLLNENKVFDAYAGFKGVLSQRTSFNIGASYARVTNKALFVTDTLFSNRNKFAVIYDTMNIMTVEGSMSYQINEKLKVDGIGRFFSYETKSQAFAWNLPQLQFVLRGNYTLKEKFVFNVDMALETGRKALVFDSTIANVVVENGQYAAPLKTFADINLGFEYKYNKNISGFLQLNNMVANRYARWYNYSVMGFQVMGGVTFKF
jgi:hypothetical protein